VTWTLDNLREKQVEHLVKMADQAGWVAYAKKRAEELEQDSSGLFVGITDEVRKILNERKRDGT
jgi:hypothetical protein